MTAVSAATTARSATGTASPDTAASRPPVAYGPAVGTSHQISSPALTTTVAKSSVKRARSLGPRGAVGKASSPRRSGAYDTSTNA